MDATNEKLADRIVGLCGYTMRNSYKAEVMEVLSGYEITPKPQPPEPGSLWEHKETGERRFVVMSEDTSCLIAKSGYPLGRIEQAAWHAWAANAECLVAGKGAK